MDWKDNIVAPVDCKPKAEAFKAYANESFLVTLANKGLYKRALKDLEAGLPIELSAGDALQVKLGDETVTLNENMAQTTCTCPSKTVCKHVLMAIIVASEYASGEVSQPNDVETPPADVAEPEPEPWKELKEADIAALRKQTGKKLFEEALRLIQDGWVASFKEDEMLEASINTENITVYFPRQDSLNRAICKCGESGICKHKLIAVLSFLSSKNLLLSASEETVSFTLLTDEAKRVLEESRQFITYILDKGIISCGEKEAETAIRLSIHTESCGIGNLSRMLRSLSTDIENMLTKHVGFSQLGTFATLSRLYNTIRLIQENEGNNQALGMLIEGTRSDYYTTPIGHFTGLGAYPWQTRSEYYGVTACLYYHEKQTICTYTTSLAGYYEKTEELANLENLTRQYHKNDHWSNNLSLADLSQSSFTLRNFKLNRLNRLSSSAQTQCELTGTTTRDSVRNLPGSETLFKVSGEQETGYDYFSKKLPDDLVIIPFEHLANVYFDHTQQELHFTIERQGDISLQGAIAYTEISKEAIRYIERLFRVPDDKERFVVCLKRRSGLLPICFITDKGVYNFYFKQ